VLIKLLTSNSRQQKRQTTRMILDYR